MGDVIKAKGPAGHVLYHGDGVFTVDSTDSFKVKQVSMVAGGSGLTPCYQVSCPLAVLTVEVDKTYFEE